MKLHGLPGYVDVVNELAALPPERLGQIELEFTDAQWRRLKRDLPGAFDGRTHLCGVPFTVEPEPAHVAR